MSEPSDRKKLDEILRKYDYDPHSIIAILQDTQEVYHYLPSDIFDYYSDQLGIGRAKIFSVATFYENFSLKPKGKYVIKVCNGTACHVRNSMPILEQLRTDLDLSDKKETTDDLMFTVETVSCLGACGLAPAMMVNDKVLGQMTPEKATQLVKELKGDGANAEK